MGSGGRNAVDIVPLSTPSLWTLLRWALPHNRMSHCDKQLYPPYKRWGRGKGHVYFSAGYWTRPTSQGATEWKMG